MQYSCPNYHEIYVTLNGYSGSGTASYPDTHEQLLEPCAGERYSGSGTASYPDTAQVSVNTPATEGVNYPWTREFIDYAQQRGGQCGPISDVVRNWSAGFAVTYTQSTNLYSDSNGNCPQINACTNGSPKCVITNVNEGPTLTTCDLWHVTLRVVLNGICNPAGVSTYVNGPGACSLP